MKWLIYGHKGWVGSYLKLILEMSEEEIILGEARLDNDVDIEGEVKKHMPDRIITTCGRTSGPEYASIDYLEQKGKLIENVRDNLYGPINLANVCKKYNIHMTYLGTGCIFNGYPTNGYTEEDEPDFFGSGYSTVKGITDRLIKKYPNVLNVRIRMPITADINPKNFIVKILTYKKICSMDNSMTVLPDLLPVMIDMASKKETGTINLTNPGLISHNDILQMVKEIVDPSFTWENFSIEEQKLVLLSDRSNNLLNTDKLQKMYPQIKNIKESVRDIIQIMFNEGVLCKKIGFKDGYKSFLYFLKNDFETTAWKGHFEFAMWLTNKYNPQVTVDLGVDYGHSTFALAYQNKGKVYGIDSFEGDEFTGYSNTYDIVKNTYKQLVEQKVLDDNIIIKGFFNDIYDIFGKKIDILHIDGTHSYEDVKNDFEKWSTKISDNGIILIHDVVSYIDTVGKLFSEITLPKTMMIHSAGLGVVSKNQQIIDEINVLWINKLKYTDDMCIHTEFGLDIFK